MLDSPSDFFNYATFGFTGMVQGAVNPKDPLSKEHWLDSFGVATSVLGVKGASTTKPTGVTSGKSTSSSSSSSSNSNKSTDEIGWSMPKGGGEINGRKYSQHALERMEPDTPEVKATLTSRAIKKAEELGYKPQTKEFSDFIKKYVDPRNIPPSVIEDAIMNTKKTPGNGGTFVRKTKDVKVIINEAGDVITVIPK